MLLFWPCLWGLTLVYDFQSNLFNYFFGEDQARYIVEVKSTNINKFQKILDNNSVHYDEIGIVTIKDIIIDKEPILHIDELIESNKNWLTNYMEN